MTVDAAMGNAGRMEITMDEAKILEKVAGVDGVYNCAFVDTKDLVFRPEFRSLCEEDTCGNYDVNYSCPPYCGTPEEMQAKVMQYKRLLVMQTAWDVSDVMNTEETKEAKAKHNAISFQVLDELKALGIESDAMMAGPCKQCKKVCMQMIGEPCPRDYKVYSCLSAYCLDVTHLAETVGMECWCGNTRVLYFSVFMFEK